jgi:heptosyltransferase-2
MTNYQKSASNRILVIGPAWIGDMVMAQTLFKYLKSTTPTVIIDVLAPKWTLPLVERMPEVNDGIVLPLGHGELNLTLRLKIAKSLRSKEYQQAIVLPGSFKSALIPWWARIPLRTGWLGEWRIGLLNDYRHLDKEALPLMIQRFMALGHPKNGQLPSSLQEFYPQLILDATLREQTLSKFNIANDRPILALCPGAEYGPAKRWPSEYFAQVALKKIQEGWQVLIFGSAKEVELAEMIKQDIDQDCHNLCGKTSLLEAMELLAVAKVTISNDSGLMHIAAAVGSPLIVIYGSSSPRFTPPLAENIAIVSQELPCSPCFKRNCPLEHFNCMRQLTPTKILSHMNSLLSYE